MPRNLLVRLRRLISTSLAASLVFSISNTVSVAQGAANENSLESSKAGAVYETWAQMADQAARRIERTLERFGLEAPKGLVGRDGFLDVHQLALAASQAAIKRGDKGDQTKRQSHQKSVLAFLDRATLINTKLVDLGEAKAEGTGAVTLRQDIEDLSKTRFFGDIDVAIPARLTAKIEGEARNRIYWPQTISRLVIRISNSGGVSARGVRAQLKPEASVITALSMDKGTCAANGNGWDCAIDALGPGEEWPIRIAFRHAAPGGIKQGPPTVVSVGIALAATDTATPAIDTSASFRVANCAANYHNSLQRMFKDEGAALLAALNAAQKGNTGLPRRWLIEPARVKEKAHTTRLNKARKIVKARGIDPWLATQASGQHVARVVHGLRTYLRQEQYPALCSGAYQLTSAYKNFLNDFDQRRDSSAEDASAALKFASVAIDRATAALGGQGDAGDLPNLDKEIERLAALLDLPPVPPDADAKLPLFGRLNALVPAAVGISGKDARVAVNNAVSALEVAFYLTRSHSEYRKLSDALDKTFAAISQNLKADCRCETGGYSMLPKDAAIPVVGANVPVASKSPAKKQTARKTKVRKSAPARRTAKPKVAPRVSTRRSVRRAPRLAPQVAPAVRTTRPRATIQPRQRRGTRRYIRRFDRMTGRWVLIPVN